MEQTPSPLDPAVPASDRTAHPPPRFYAPLFSVLNPIEDSALAAAATTTAAAASTQAEALPSDAVPLSQANANDENVPLLAPQTAESAAATTEQHAAVTWRSAFLREWHQMCSAYAREVVPVDQPRPLSASERAKMARYESVDTYEPESVLYKDHLETRSHEPRWFMWVFVLLLGLGTSALSLGTAACLHVLNSVRYELLGFGLRGFRFVDAHRYVDANASGAELDVWAMLKGHNVGLYGAARPLSYGGGYLLWLAFALTASALASGVCYLVPESVGSGVPEVKAYLNGVAYPMMRSTRVLVAKMVAVILTVASGVCTGHYGHLMLAGAMLGAQLLQRRHGFRCHHVHFVECFRNPRDRRVILVVGAAAGVASAFCVSVGGLLVVLELLSAVFPVRFALYVFAACLLSTLCTQVYLSYWVNFDTRYRPSGGLQRGELLSEAVVLFRTHLPFGQQPAMNLMDFVVAFIIGLCSGACAVIFVRVSWTALYLRRRLEVALGSKAIRYVLPILFTLLYASLQYGVAVGFTYEPPRGSEKGSSGDGSSSSSGTVPSVSSSTRTAAAVVVPEVCRPVPYAVWSGRNVSTISYYGMSGFLCPADLAEPYRARGEGLAADPRFSFDHGGKSPASVVVVEGSLKAEQSVRVVDAYASLAFAYADSTLQTLLSQRTAELLPWRALATFTVLYFFSSALYSGLALCGDTLLPSLVIGAALGRCVGAVVHAVAADMSPSTASWADPGVFALFGAGSFVSATTGLSFGVGAVLIESTADFRHLLPLMFAILVARRVLSWRSRDALTVYLEARAVPLLNAEPYMDRYTLLDARDVMHGPVAALPVVCGLDEISRVLHHTTHHAFPVVSAHDGTCKGIVTRAQLELLLWHLLLSQGRVSHCTYEILQRVADHVFHRGWEGRDPTELLPPSVLQSSQISLYPHVDTSAFTVLDTTALSGVYEMFTTLGLRHLIVVDRGNYAVGMVTRKDLMGDHLSRVSAAMEMHSSGDAPDTLHAAAGRGGARERGGNAALAAALATLRAPLHPSASQVAEVARTSSTRRLPPARQQEGHGDAAPAEHHTFPVGSVGEPIYTQAIRRVSLLHLPRRADVAAYSFAG